MASMESFDESVAKLINDEVYQAISQGKYDEARLLADGLLVEYLITNSGTSTYSPEQLKQYQQKTIDNLIEVQ